MYRSKTAGKAEVKLKCVIVRMGIKIGQFVDGEGDIKLSLDTSMSSHTSLPFA
jgi:hypothetical protein